MTSHSNRVHPKWRATETEDTVDVYRIPYYADEHDEKEDAETAFAGEDPMPEISDSSLPKAEVRSLYYINIYLFYYFCFCKLENFAGSLT